MTIWFVLTGDIDVNAGGNLGYILGFNLGAPAFSLTHTHSKFVAVYMSNRNYKVISTAI